MLVPLLEEHLADLNTALALNTMALAAFGIIPPPSLAATGHDDPYGEER